MPCFWRKPREPPPPSSPATASQRQQPQVKPGPARAPACSPQPPGAPVPHTWARSKGSLRLAMALPLRPPGHRSCHVRPPRLRARRFPGQRPRRVCFRGRAALAVAVRSVLSSPARSSSCGPAAGTCACGAWRARPELAGGFAQQGHRLTGLGAECRRPSVHLASAPRPAGGQAGLLKSCSHRVLTVKNV